MITLTRLQEEVYVWSHHNFPKAEPGDPLLGMIEELGELAHAFLKAKQGIRGTPEKHHADMEDAIGDLLIYMADFCGRNNIDLQRVLEDIWDDVGMRDWVKFPKNGRTE